MNPGVHPIVLLAALGVFLAVVAVVIACLGRSTGIKISATVLALVFLLPAVCILLALHPELIDGRFRTYKAFYQDIQIGMTRDEVLSAMGRHYPKPGTRQRPTIMDDQPERLGFFMNPESSREPNCEGIFLGLRNGRVTSKQYSPD